MNKKIHQFKDFTMQVYGDCFSVITHKGTVRVQYMDCFGSRQYMISDTEGGINTSAVGKTVRVMDYFNTPKVFVDNDAVGEGIRVLEKCLEGLIDFKSADKLIRAIDELIKCGDRKQYKFN